MKLLAIGPSDSTIQLGEKLKNLNPDIKTIGLHRAFPYLKQNHNIDLDYWTWGDPNSTQMGFDYIKNNPNEPIPHIILPKWSKTISTFNNLSGTTQLNRYPKRIREYEDTLQKFEKKGKVTFIENALPTKGIKDTQLITNPKLRFSDQFTIFGTVPFDGIHAESNWALENKFTSLILPTCYYLGAKEVYCIGFDNRGTGINRTIPLLNNNQNHIQKFLSKYPKWVNDWKPYHNMNIYSITPDKFSPINQIMEYKSIKELK
jgi:hypothetical protein